MATVRLINKLKEKFPTEMPLLVLQLHDELIFEVSQGQLSEVEKIIKEVALLLCVIAHTTLITAVVGWLISSLI